MKQFCNFLLTATFLGLFFTNIHANEPKAGEDYIVLDTPVKTSVSSDKVEVIEVFWYGCGHCYTLEPIIDQWRPSLPSYVEFKHLPAFFSKNLWQTHAQLYYTIHLLLPEQKTFHTLHDLIFNEIHKNKNYLDTPEKMADFVAKNSKITEKQFTATYHSFGVKTLMSQSMPKLRSYRIDGVPALIIDGRYLVKSARDLQKMIKTIDFLIAKVHNKK